MYNTQEKVCRGQLNAVDDGTSPDFWHKRLAHMSEKGLQLLAKQSLLPTDLDLIRDTYDKVDLINKRLLMAQSRQKSYANRWWRPLEFEVGDHVFLKVMPKRGVVKFDKRGKLSPRYIGPFKVFERVGTVAYLLALPKSLLSVHAVFHVSMLRKYTLDPNHVVEMGLPRRDQCIL